MLDTDFIETKFGRVKITEITGETRSHTRRERMRDGSWQMVTRELNFKRPLVLAPWWMRLIHFIVDMYLVSFAIMLATMVIFPSTRNGVFPLVFFASFFLISSSSNSFFKRRCQSW